MVTINDSNKLNDSSFGESNEVVTEHNRVTVVVFSFYFLHFEENMFKIRWISCSCLKWSATRFLIRILKGEVKLR